MDYNSTDSTNQTQTEEFSPAKQNQLHSLEKLNYMPHVINNLSEDELSKIIQSEQLEHTVKISKYITFIVGIQIAIIAIGGIGFLAFLMGL